MILNGVPRSGKSSIAEAIQQSFEGIWINLGVDVFMQGTPEALRPGIGLRPGGERPDLEPAVSKLYAALFESAASASRLGVCVVMDVGLHASYASSMNPLADCAERLAELPAVLVGVRCPTEIVLERRRASGWQDESRVELWEREVHCPGIYDLEVNTSLSSPAQCAAAIRAFLDSGKPATALSRLSESAS